MATIDVENDCGGGGTHLRFADYVPDSDHRGLVWKLCGASAIIAGMIASAVVGYMAGQRTPKVTKIKTPSGVVEIER